MSAGVVRLEKTIIYLQISIFSTQHFVMRNTLPIFITLFVLLTLAIATKRGTRHSSVVERSYQLNPGSVTVMQVTFGTDGTLRVDSAEVSVTQKNIDPFVLRNLERYVAWFNIENKDGVHPQPYGFNHYRK